MDPIKEAMIREEDTGEINPALDPYRASAATPKAELERQIMSSAVPKNEREWWARLEIEQLRTRQEEVMRLTDKPTLDDVMRAICCPRGCQARDSDSMCHTCRNQHQTQAEAVMKLYG